MNGLIRAPILLLLLLVVSPGSPMGCFTSDTRQASSPDGRQGEGESEGEGEGGGSTDAGPAGADAGDGGGPAPGPCSPAGVAQGYALGERVPPMGFGGPDGHPFALEDHCGEVVLIEAGSATCGACAAVVPDLIELYRRHQAAGLTVLYVLTANRQNEQPSTQDLRDFQALHHMPFPVVADAEGMLVFFMEGDMAIPIDLLLDRRMILRLKGGSVDRAYLAGQVQAALD